MTTTIKLWTMPAGFALAATALAAFAWPVHADGPIPPATQPSVTGDDSPPPMDDPGPPGPGPIHGRGRFALPTQKDRDEAMAFMEKHSPNRFKAMQSLSEESKKELTTGIAFRYMASKHLETDEPELYKVVVDRTEVEDAIFDLAIKVQKSPDDAGTKSLLRVQVGKWVDINLRERNLRLERLQQTVKREQKRLTEDERDRGSLIEKRLDAVLKSDAAQQLVPRPGPGGPRGGRHGNEGDPK